jgi:Zn-dependent protease
MEFNLIQTIAIYAIPVVFAITLHEAAHGYVAKYFGDLTAERAGRITLNPLKHIDLMGTVIVPAALLLMSKALGMQGILFGWAKPVPVDFAKLRNPKKDMLWVAAAGPGINFAMAIGWAFLLKAATIAPENNYSLPLRLMSEAGIQINAVLMILNLLPVPPLDGGRIAVSLLPSNIAYRFAALERYGLFIILALLFTGVLSTIMGPFIVAVISLVSVIAGL